MAQLDIYLLGNLEVYRDGVRLSGLSQQKSGSLLCLLLLNRQYPQSREALAEALWPDLEPEATRKYLRTALWRLRSVLEPSGTPSGSYVLVSRDSISFNTESDFWLDVEVFESLVERVPDETEQERVERLGRATELYRGDLLESSYEDWCSYERARLAELHTAALSELIAHHARRREFDKAIQCGQAILKHDRAQEHIHREIMRLHSLAGRRGAAVQQYHVCRDVLRQDLGVEPMRETVELYERVCSESALGDDELAHLDQAEPIWAPMTGLKGRSHGGDALRVLLAELDRLEEATARVRQAIAGLERGRKPGAGLSRARLRARAQPERPAPGRQVAS